MNSLRTRGVLCALLAGGALAACSESDPTPVNPGTMGGTSSGGSAGTGPSGGTGGSATAGSGGSAMAGTGGSAGSGGSSGGSAGTAGSGGSAGVGGSGGSAGSAGAGGAGQNPTAMAVIAGVNASPISGTATFTQMGEEVTLVIELMNCPDGEHASHLHENKDCGDNGDAAGGHWVPNGEMLGNYTCTGGTAMHMTSKPTSTWTIGDGGDTDVTQFSFMVHEGPDPAPGGRIGCGVIDAP